MDDPRTPLALRERGEGWHLEPRRNRGLRVVGVLIGALALLGAGDLLAGGRPLRAALVAVVGGVLASLPFTTTRTPPPVDPRVHDGGLLLPARPMSLPLLGGLLVLGLVCAAGAVVLLVSALRDETWSDLVGVVVLGGAAALFGLGVAGGARSLRARDRGVLLTPAGVRITSRHEPVEVAWDEIAGIRPHWTRLARAGLTSSGDTVHNWLTLELRHAPAAPGPLAALAGTDHPTVAVTDLAVEPHRALATLRLHLARPEGRRELGTEAAVRRTTGPPGQPDDPRHAPDEGGPDQPSGV